MAERQITPQTDLAMMGMLGRIGKLPRVGSPRRGRSYAPDPRSDPEALERSDGFRRATDLLESADAARAAIADTVAELAVATLDLQPLDTSLRGRGQTRRTILSDGTLLLLEPDLPYDATAIVEGALSFDRLLTIARARMVSGNEPLLRLLDPHTIAAAIPPVVRTRLPQMEPLCVPTPRIELVCNGQTSTAGILCRDAAGRLGLTACLHGTGPVGTMVQVGLRTVTVAADHPVQDIVFLPLGDGVNLPEMIGVAGVNAARAPAQGMAARFDGATSGATDTWISSHDVGLLRRGAMLQLKVQTGPDANAGDSGAALIDEDDQVIGFAFHRTAWGERPAFTDWIWAANALAALGLTPVTVQKQ